MAVDTSRNVHRPKLGCAPELGVSVGPRTKQNVDGRRIDELADEPLAPGRHLPTKKVSVAASSRQGVVGIRGAELGPVRGMRALRAMTGLEGRVPLRHLRTLGDVRRHMARLDALDTDQLVVRFEAHRTRLGSGAANLERVLPEALAIAALVSARALGQPPRDEQLLAAIAMVRQSAVELATGEGKTLAVGLAASVIALEGKGVHVLTANAYLADRDSENLDPLYRTLGLSVGLASNDGSASRYDEKRRAYAADVTYGDVNAVAFDWLEDQTWWRKESRVMRKTGLPFALVDEMDHAMLDTALKPLVLSRFPNAGESTPVDEQLLRDAMRIVDALSEEDVTVYLEGDYPKPTLTDSGVTKVEQLVREVCALERDASVWEIEHLPVLAEIQMALEAKISVRAGHDYIRTKDDIVLIDHATGRPNPAGRLRHGLHNAVRTREGLPPEPSMQTIAMGSYHHFFRAYDKRAGTTATANGAAEELADLHRLQLVRIPTHRESLRVDLPDRIFAHPALRDAAVLTDLVRRHEAGQPVLVSTVSVASSKRLSAMVRDPLLAVAAAACSSWALLSAAAEHVMDADELLDRADAQSDDDARAQLAGTMAERMREDPDGTARFVAWLAERGLDLSALLAHRMGLSHRVLNAENHADEAHVIEGAGEGGAIIIATQMAGRGVHIDVPDDVLEIGGLHVIGVERKTNVRHDLQLVGRSGRCGAIGSTQFFLSPADEFLAHLAASERRAIARRLGGDAPELTNGVRRFFFARAVKAAQRAAEAREASIRYINARLDEAVELQRQAVQRFRDDAIDSADPLAPILEWIDAWAQADEAEVRAIFGLGGQKGDVSEAVRAMLAARDAAAGVDEAASRDFVRHMILFHFDQAWIDQLESHEMLRSTALMRTQFNTWAENTAESTRSFEMMCADAQETVVRRLAFHLTGIA